MITLHASKTFYIPSKIVSQGNPSLNISAGFSTKMFGDARRDDVIVKLLRDEYSGGNYIVRPEQTHSTTIRIISKDDVTNSPDTCIVVPNTDGVITKEKNVVLTCITGDCVPIMFADVKNGVVGVSHQGWKGSLGRMAQKMIESMCEIGAEKKYLYAAIGPAIGSCCYAVYGERLELFYKEFSNYTNSQLRIIEKRNTTHYLNLSLLNYMQLCEVGIQESHIDHRIFCTSCDSANFYSYQRDYGTDRWGEMVTYINY